VLDTHDEFHSFCAALGFVEVNWALFEQNIDHWVSIIFGSLGGRAISWEIPRPFSAKAKFLRRSFNKIPLLHAYTNDATMILQRADALAQTRNDLMHGVVTHIRPIRGEYRLSKIDYEKERHVYREVVFAIRAFPKLAQDLVDLGTDAAHLGLKLLALEARLRRAGPHR